MLNILKNIVVYAAILIIGMYFSVWAFSPFAANYFISQSLEEHQLELKDESTIRYNPFLSRLDIDTLAITKNSENVFKLSSLTLEISAYQLLFNEVNVTKLLIDGLYLVVDKQNESFSIAGINIPSAKIEEGKTKPVHSENDDKAENNSELSDTPATELALQLIMPSMRLTNSAINIIDSDKEHTLQLKEVSVDVTKITSSLQNLSLNVFADLDGSDISIFASTELINEIGDINFEIDIEEVDLFKFDHWFSPYISVTNGLVSYKGKHSIQLSKDGIRLEIEDLGFHSQGIAFNKNDIHFSLGEQDFNSELMSLDLSTDAHFVVTGSGDLQWRDITAFNKMTHQVLLAIAQLSLSDVGIYTESGANNHSDSKEAEYRITINDISLLDSFFSNDTEDEIPALTLFSELTINETELTNKELIMDSIALAGLKSNIQLAEDKHIKNLIMTLEELSQAISTDSNDGAGSAQLENKEQQAPSLHIQLNRFSLVDSFNIQFSDQSVSPNYARYVKINELTAGPFDNAKPNQTTVVKMKGISNQYTNFDFVMDTKPFLPEPEYHLKGILNQLDLESLTPYVKDALGYEIESGQLDLNLDVQLIGTQIDGDSHIFLRGIELSSVEDYEKDESSGQSYIAFNTALGMLKDSDGNVELDLPISGDTSSPSFGLSGFVTLIVKRATIAGAKDYLTMTFVPYASLVKIVMAADKHLLKVQISDLNYEPTIVEITEEQQEFLTTFSDLLKDKSDLQIKLCGVSTAEDIGKEKGAKLNKEEVEALMGISEQRGSNFKKYMVEEQNISSSRLLLCKPRIDNNVDSVPHVRFET